MHFPEEDEPVLKEWLVKRLADVTDADPDVLADYILALLSNENNDTSVQEVFNTEINPFLRDDTKGFTSEIIQAVKTRSYLPGGPPPPPQSHNPATIPPFFGVPKSGPVPSQQTYYPTSPTAGGNKRRFQDRGDFDAPDGRDDFPGGGRAFKQPRRGGGRRGYVDPDRPQPAQDLNYGYNPRQPSLSMNAPAFQPTAPHVDMPNFGPGGLDPMEAMRKIQELQQQIGMMAGFGSFSQPQQGYAPQAPPQQKRRGRCRDYDNKGYCARGHKCMYEHNNEPEGMFNNLPAPMMSGQIQLPSGGQSLFDFNSLASSQNNLSSSQDGAGGTPKPFQGASFMPTPGALTGSNSIPLCGNLPYHVRDSSQRLPLDPISAHKTAQSFTFDPHFSFNTQAAPMGLGINPGPAFSSSPGGNFAAPDTSSGQQNTGGPKSGCGIPGLGLLDSPSGVVTPTSADDSKLRPGSEWHGLTTAADIQQSIESLFPPFSGSTKDVDMDRLNSQSNSREIRQVPEHRRMKYGAPPARAPFSHTGQMRDKTQSTVVVERIPEDHFEEKKVRDFFGQFGTIEDVTMMPYKRLALVKFDTWQSAMNAYQSPKVVFNNRFVKVFWYKPERQGDPTNGSGLHEKQADPSERNRPHEPTDTEESAIDMEEFKKQQDEAQKAHEEKKRMKQDLTEKRAELEKKRKELQAKQEEEKQKLYAKLAEAKSKVGTEDTVVKKESADPSKPLTQTEVLRATLAKLQEEAKSLNIDPNAHLQEDVSVTTHSEYSPYPSYSPYTPRGRGGYYPRGRGGYVPRGAYRGRGGPVGRGNIHAAYAAFSLDNRPRKVGLTGIDFSVPEKDEALRQHLFSLGEFTANMEVTPAKTIVSFSDRKAAEKFYATVADSLSAATATNSDKLELTWVANTAGPLAGGATVTKIEAHANGNGNGNAGGPSRSSDIGDGLDADMADADGAKPGGQQPHQQSGPAAVDGVDEDYDVAGDNEWDIS